MKLIDVSTYSVRLEMDGEDCRLLALGCRAAAESLISPQETPLALFLEAAGAAFQACATAAYGQIHMGAPNLQALHRELRKLDLMEPLTPSAP